MKKILNLLSLLLLTLSINAQEIVSTQYLESQTAGQLQAQFFQNFNNGVDMYRVLYKTTDIQGQPDTASGLLIVPDESEYIYPLLCYQHGTVNSRWDVPSQLAGGYELAMAISGMGYAVIAPDFLGLGESRGLHPYVHAETEARAAIDLLYAARQFDDENDFLTLNDQIFITGYSQGGHAAFAAHKVIQEEFSTDFTVTASAPMSGPYSISDKMIDFTLGDAEYDFVAYIVWTTLSYNLEDGSLFTDYSEIFKAPYVPFVAQFANEEITLNELNTALISTLIAENGPGQVKPKLMIQDGILDAILNDPNHPMSLALAENDLIDWVPTAPTRLVACANDDQVTNQNALYASEVMNNNGAVDLEAHDPSPSADHGACVFPATLFVIDFFQQYQQITVANREPLSSNALFSIQPNPASDYVLIQLTDSANTSSSYQLRLYNLNGILIDQTIMRGNEILKVPTTNYPSGVYLLQLTGAEGSFTKRVVVK